MECVRFHNVAQAKRYVVLLTDLVWQDDGLYFPSLWLVTALFPPTLPREDPRFELKSSSFQDALHICCNGLQTIRVIVGREDVINVAVVLENLPLFPEVSERR